MATEAERAGLQPLLDEQAAYYRAVAPEHDTQGLGLRGGNELVAALDALCPAGQVLELACGPGVWTGQLLRHADPVTAVDASPEMLALARARHGRHAARFVHADLFDWKPDRCYDVVFFGFWLSHVPRELFEAFWSVVAQCLRPDGRVFFVDDAYRTPEELIEGPSSSVIRRRSSDGTAYRVVKVPHTPASLEEQLTDLGWQISVTQTSGPFSWGAGSRSPEAPPP